MSGHKEELQLILPAETSDRTTDDIFDIVRDPQFDPIRDGLKQRHELSTGFDQPITKLVFIPEQKRFLQYGAENLFEEIVAESDKFIELTEYLRNVRLEISQQEKNGQRLYRERVSAFIANIKDIKETIIHESERHLDFLEKYVEQELLPNLEKVVNSPYLSMEELDTRTDAITQFFVETWASYEQTIALIDELLVKLSDPKNVARLDSEPELPKNPLPFATAIKNRLGFGKVAAAVPLIPSLIGPLSHLDNPQFSGTRHQPAQYENAQFTQVSENLIRLFQIEDRLNYIYEQCAALIEGFDLPINQDQNQAKTEMPSFSVDSSYLLNHDIPNYKIHNGHVEIDNQNSLDAGSIVSTVTREEAERYFSLLNNQGRTSGFVLESDPEHPHLLNLIVLGRATGSTKEIGRYALIGITDKDGNKQIKLIFREDLDELKPLQNQDAIASHLRTAQPTVEAGMASGDSDLNRSDLRSDNPETTGFQPNQGEVVTQPPYTPDQVRVIASTFNVENDTFLVGLSGSGSAESAPSPTATPTALPEFTSEPQLQWAANTGTELNIIAVTGSDQDGSYDFSIRVNEDCTMDWFFQLDNGTVLSGPIYKMEGMAVAFLPENRLFMSGELFGMVTPDNSSPTGPGWNELLCDMPLTTAKRIAAVQGIQTTEGPFHNDNGSISVLDANGKEWVLNQEGSLFEENRTSQTPQETLASNGLQDVYSSALPEQLAQYQAETGDVVTWNAEFLGFQRASDNAVFQPKLGYVADASAGQGHEYDESDFKEGWVIFTEPFVSPDFVPGVSGIKIYIGVATTNPVLDRVSWHSQLLANSDAKQYITNDYLRNFPSQAGQTLMYNITGHDEGVARSGNQIIGNTVAYDIDRIRDKNVIFIQASLSLENYFDNDEKSFDLWLRTISMSSLLMIGQYIETGDIREVVEMPSGIIVNDWIEKTAPFVGYTYQQLLEGKYLLIEADYDSGYIPQH